MELNYVCWLCSLFHKHPDTDRSWCWSWSIIKNIFSSGCSNQSVSWSQYNYWYQNLFLFVMREYRDTDRNNVIHFTHCKERFLVGCKIKQTRSYHALIETNDWNREMTAKHTVSGLHLSLCLTVASYLSTLYAKRTLPSRRSLLSLLHLFTLKLHKFFVNNQT